MIRWLEQSVNEILVMARSERDDCESLAESLTLSDEKSLGDSFTSLNTDDMDRGAAALLDQTSQTRSLQNLDVDVDVEGDNPRPTHFRRQTWETRSMTNLERLSRDSTTDKVNISVGGWCESRDSSDETNKTKGSFVRKRDLWEKRASLTPSSQLNLRQKHTPDLVMDLPPSLPLSCSPKDDSEVVAPSVRQRHESESSSSSSGSSSQSPSSPVMTTAAETFAMQNQSTLKKSTVKPAKKEENVPFEQPMAAPLKEKEQTPRPAKVESSSAVKLHIAAYSSATGSNSPAVTNPVRTTTTPKLASRFSHLYGTPMPVLPVAFAAAAAAGESPMDGKPQVKLKPQVLKKPTLPSLNSPESSRRSGVDQDSSLV